MAELAADHRNRVEQIEPGLLGIRTEPGFGIGQRALHVNGVLWDCITLIDADTEKAVRAAGGVHTIAISHPHYYSAMVEWAERLGARMLLHEADREHVMRPDARVEYWSGEWLDLGDGLELHRLRGPLRRRGGGPWGGGGRRPG